MLLSLYPGFFPSKPFLQLARATLNCNPALQGACSPPPCFLSYVNLITAFSAPSIISIMKTMSITKARTDPWGISLTPVLQFNSKPWITTSNSAWWNFVHPHYRLTDQTPRLLQRKPPIKEGVISIREVQLHYHRRCWEVFAKHCHKNIMHADKRNRRADNQALGWQENFSCLRTETAGAWLRFQQERGLEEANWNSIKMTGILYLPSTAADLSVKEDTITEVWFWVSGFFFNLKKTFS